MSIYGVFTDNGWKRATPLGVDPSVVLNVEMKEYTLSRLSGGAQAAQTAKTVYKRLNGIVKGYFFWIGIDERLSSAQELRQSIYV